MRESYTSNVNKWSKLQVSGVGQERPVDADWQRLARNAGYRATKLAELSQVSLRTLQRHFRAQYSQTVSDWLTELRLRDAEDRIRAGGRVKEVALDLGYKQLSHFSRAFKRAHGQPPSRVTPEAQQRHAS
jgi:AraC-like DNA-binding protein